MTTQRQPSFFESDRLNLDEAIDLSLDSLRAYGERYRHWAVAYSGGKDSTATQTAPSRWMPSASLSTALWPSSQGSCDEQTNSHSPR